MTETKQGAVLKVLAVAMGFCLLDLALAAEEQAVAYVSNQDGGVTVIGLDSLTKLGEFDGESKSPRGIGVTADGKYVLTANRDSGDMSVLDAKTRKLVKRIAIGQNPEFIRVYGDQAYVTYEPSSKGGPPGQAEEDDDDGGEKIPAGIAVVDLKEFKVLRTIMSGPETEGLEFSPDGKMLLVTNEGDDTITVYALPDGKLLKTIDTKKQGARPRGIKISPNEQLYAVTLEYGDKLMIMDRDLKPLKTVPTGKTPYGVAFDREGKRLFVAASRAKQLQVFDTKSFELVKSIPVGDRCWHFSFTPDDSKIMLACGKSHEVIVIDAKSYEVVKKIGGLKMPWGIVAYPKAMGSLDTP
jgi:YVTN family beta-propeller protein